ncbi:unnamed protein product [Prorocentrum cordatum]|uniref:Uncharacterized protein n=1 Tax=Prorocentrum cordatum TaxID=2364126 RepID=A0ABN9PZV9_9DINO|nr:unnamed protein product [Polarella glacialis]
MVSLANGVASGTPALRNLRVIAVLGTRPLPTRLFVRGLESSSHVELGSLSSTLTESFKECELQPSVRPLPPGHNGKPRFRVTFSLVTLPTVTSATFMHGIVSEVFALLSSFYVLILADVV